MQGDWSGTQIDWPGDWTVRPTDGGQLEIVDVPTGIVLARTGSASSWVRLTPQKPFNSDGEFVACGQTTPGPG